MRNNVFRVLVIIMVVVLMSGCGSNKSLKRDEVDAKNILDNKTTTKVKDDGKILVVYFSKTGENYNVGSVKVGNTAMMASYIKDYLGVDSSEIVPVKSYPDNYKEATEVATKEKNENARPSIKNEINIDKYDTIFIGYPIWWGDMPMIVYTFLESYDFNGKTIIPFNTHEGSGESGTYNIIKNKLKEANVNTNGLALQGKVARSDNGRKQTIKWLEELGY